MSSLFDTLKFTGVLKDLGASTDDLIMEIPIEHLKLLEGEYTKTSDANKKIVYAVENGELAGKDRGHTIKFVPIGHNEFLYPGAGVRIVFDTKDPNVIILTFPNKSKYKNVK